MGTINYSNRLEQSIRLSIKELLHFLLKCKDRTEKIKKLQMRQRELDEDNFEFKGMISNSSVSNRMLMYAVICILCVLIDFFLLFNGLTLLSNISTVSLLLKIALPILMVIAEIGISYFSLIRQNTGENTSWLGKNLQYFVIAILTAFSIMVIIYSGQGYNDQIDGGSKFTYFFGCLITQIILLIPAVMLHLWIIRNAEEIAEAAAYFKYKFLRKSLVTRIEKNESLQTKGQSFFVKMAYSLVEQIDKFKRRYPNISCPFQNTMPVVLIIAINTAMGRRVLDDTYASDNISLKN